jgi:hypothetical protein
VMRRHRPITDRFGGDGTLLHRDKPEVPGIEALTLLP